MELEHVGPKVRQLASKTQLGLEQVSIYWKIDPPTPGEGGISADVNWGEKYEKGKRKRGKCKIKRKKRERQRKKRQRKRKKKAKKKGEKGKKKRKWEVKG